MFLIFFTEKTSSKLEFLMASNTLKREQKKKKRRKENAQEIDDGPSRTLSQEPIRNRTIMGLLHDPSRKEKQVSIIMLKRTQSYYYYQ